MKLRHSGMYTEHGVVKKSISPPQLPYCHQRSITCQYTKLFCNYLAQYQCCFLLHWEKELNHGIICQQSQSTNFLMIAVAVF